MRSPSADDGAFVFIAAMMEVIIICRVSRFLIEKGDDDNWSLVRKLLAFKTENDILICSNKVSTINSNINTVKVTELSQQSSVDHPPLFLFLEFYCAKNTAKSLEST